MDKKTAILFFARSAAEESKIKLLSSSQGMNKRLFEVFNKRTEKLIKKTRLPYFVIDESKQNGNSFGERFANAFQQLFDLGFQQVISVGNDAPQLQVSHIFDAQAALENSPFVIGKDKRGGAYLIGIQKDNFNIYSFQNLNWQSPYLIDSFCNAYQNQSIIWIESLIDINQISDLKTLCSKFGIPYKLKQLIRSILHQSVKVLPSRLDILWYNPELENHGLRAPPFS